MSSSTNTNSSTHPNSGSHIVPGMLIVDDSADSRSFCELIAQMFNVEVQKAKNVDDALMLLERGFRPQVVLLDLIMPGSPPEVLVRKIKSDPGLTSTRVVIMSALREVTARAKEMGVDGALRKPFNMSRFVSALGLERLGLQPIRNAPYASLIK